MSQQSHKFVNLFEAPFRCAWFTETYTHIFAHDSEFAHFPSHGYKNLINSIENNAMTAYHSESEIAMAPQWGYKGHTTNKFLAMHLRDTRKGIKAAHKFYQTFVGGRVSLKTKSKQTQFIKKLYDVFHNISAFYKLYNDEYQILAGDEVISWICNNEKCTKEHARERVQSLILSGEVSTLEKMELEEFRAALSAKTLKQKEIVARKLALSYLPLGIGMEGGVAWDEKYFVNAITTLQKQSREILSAKIKSLEQKPKRNSKLRKDYYKQFNVPSQIRLFINNFALFAHLKLELRMCWSFLDYVTLQFYGVICDEKKYSLDNLKYYLYPEAVAFVEKDVRLSDSELSSRKALFLFVVEDGNYFTLSGNEARAYLSEKVKISDTSKLQSVTGQVASRGIVRGIARIVSPLKNQEQELARVKDGDVIITGMTRPHMIVAMRKAAAFVTDEGGITCHASIVARELHKPCVIATRIGTKVFLDGDLVEVNANTGVVSLVKRVTALGANKNIRK